MGIDLENLQNFGNPLNNICSLTEKYGLKIILELSLNCFTSSPYRKTLKKKFTDQTRHLGFCEFRKNYKILLTYPKL